MTYALRQAVSFSRKWKKQIKKKNKKAVGRFSKVRMEEGRRGGEGKGGGFRGGSRRRGERGGWEGGEETEERD